jgi:hypothetical protein
MHAAFASSNENRSAYSQYDHEALFIKLKTWIRLMSVYRVIDAPIDQVIRLQMIVMVKGARMQNKANVPKASTVPQ